jgi:hypothetical protein
VRVCVLYERVCVRVRRKTGISDSDIRNASVRDSDIRNASVRVIRKRKYEGQG